MKRNIFLGILMLMFLGTSAFSQSIVLCITVDGILLPPNKMATLCKKDTATLIVTNCASSPTFDVSIKWRNIDVAPNDDSLDFEVSATKPGRWVAYITNTSTLVDYTDTLFLSYPPAFDVALDDAGLGAACPLASQTLTGTPSGPVVSYQWYEYSISGITTKINGQTNNSYSFVKKNTYYFLEVKDANGCVEYDTSKQIPQGSAFVVDLGPSVGPDTLTYCEGATLTLQSIEPHVYYLSPGNPAVPPSGYYYSYRLLNSAGSFSFNYENTNLHVPPSFTTTATPVSPTPSSAPLVGMNKYSLYISAPGFICPNSDTLYVVIQPKPDFDYKDTTLCYGGSVTMKPVIAAGNPVTGWSWAPSTGLSSTGIKEPVVSNLSANQTYTITATNACGTDNATVLVKYNPPINLTTSDDTSICIKPAGTATLSGSATGGTPGSPILYSYAWTPAATLTPPVTMDATTTAPLVTTANPTVTTVYTFTAKDDSSCTNSKNVTVTLYAPPINIIASPQIINEDVSTTLDAAVAGNTGMTFLWTDSLATVYSTTPSLFLEYLGPDTTLYIIVVTDPSNGCINSDSIEIRSISNNTLMYVPNIFSPNASNPQNQTLKIYGDNLLPDGFKWLVYNKWGNLMYETTNLAEAQSIGWNGGAQAEEGVYTYVIVGKFKNGKDVKESSHYKGTFSLVK